jgi:hypothetical protein
MEPALAFILSEKGVPQDIQDLFITEGVRSVSIFSHLADAPAELRQILKDDYGLDPTENALTVDVRRARRSNLARVLDAWGAATIRVSEANKRDAERRADRMPKVVAGNEHVEMRFAFERRFGRIADKIWPCEMLVEGRLEMIENGTLEAEPLTRVVPKDLAQSNSLDLDLDKLNRFRLKEGMKEIAMPSSSEDLRRRIQTLAITFYLAKVRHPNRAFLEDAEPDVWLPHVDYILNEEVAGLEARGADGKILHKADWNLVLSFEYQLRREAVRLILYEQITLGVALERARKDMQLKERYFTTPLGFSALSSLQHFSALSISPSSQSTAASVSDTPTKWKRVKKPWAEKILRGKGKGKGKPRTKGKGKGKEMARETPDGRKLCFAFNSASEGCAGSCGFVHACRLCFGQHPAHRCGQGGPPAPQVVQ